MAKTGKDFDMNPDTFTLENLFSMQLHNFSETIAEIVTAAVKELNIEKGLKEVRACCCRGNSFLKNNVFVAICNSM